MQLDELIEQLQHWTMSRRNKVKFRTRLTNSIRGQCRWYCKEIGDNSLKKTPRSDALWAILKLHADRVAAGKVGDNSGIPCPDGIDPLLWFHIEDRFVSLTFFSAQAVQAEKEITKLAGQLPCATWVKGSDCPGFSLLNYGLLIGTVGNLSNYPNPAKLWKMASLAPYTKDGETKAGSTWRFQGGLTADDWKQLGYSPVRRSLVFNMGVRLIQAGGGMAKHGSWSRYAKLYYDRKELERRKRPDLTAAVHDRRARRVMEKRLLRDIWVRWRDAEVAGAGLKAAA